MDRLTPVQISTLTKLEFSIEHYGKRWEEDDDPCFYHWSHSLTLERISQLKGLRYLRLKLSTWFFCNLAGTQKDTDFYMPEGTEKFWNALKGFRSLPLKEVVVEENSSGLKAMMIYETAAIEGDAECVRQTLMEYVAV